MMARIKKKCVVASRFPDLGYYQQNLARPGSIDIGFMRL